MQAKKQIIDLVYNHVENDLVVFRVYKVNEEYVFTIFKNKIPDIAFSISDLDKTSKYRGYKAEIIEIFKKQLSE